MENLNDAEFGSNKSTEEAPILVAQRYLNIFRQVHIFNKAKRDQFDDELLALPPVITNFFKRMPGGRLLVEHIEEVKTERGISFVKSNKDDFAEGSGMGESSQPAQATGGAITPIVGGSITVDASFAEALANSMASAFKQNPMQATVSAGVTGSTTLDFGNTFDVIAEEIRTSRASLLDVLRETKSITDSVIASQVSISRILEGILSSRTKDNIGTADLNNRIIASQTSITKLLEGLYSANIQKNNEISDYLNIESKLKAFKNEMRTEFEQSLSKIQEMFTDYTNTLMSLQTKPINVVVEQDYSRVNYDKNDIEDDENSNQAVNVYSETSDKFSTHKKKKKKKNKNNSINNTEQKLNTFSSSTSALGINGIIRNEAFKHNDTFDNVDLNEPPLELQEKLEQRVDFQDEIKPNNDILVDSFDNDFEDDFDDGLDFVLPEQDNTFERSTSEEESSELSLDDFSAESNELDTFEAPTFETESSELSLDNFSAESDELDTFEAPTFEAEFDKLPLEEFNLENSQESEVLEDNYETIDNLFSEPSEEDDDVDKASQSRPQSLYSAELDKIRAALTSDNIDISSIDEPISLDDYNDDENIPEEEDSDEWEYEYVVDDTDEAGGDILNTESSVQEAIDEEWEYEYVDENGNPIEDNEDQDWEWEYVEEELEENNNDNKK